MLWFAFGAPASAQQSTNSIPLANPTLIDQNEPVVGVLRLSDLGTSETLQMLEQFTGKPILRQQTLPTVSINFNSQRPLTLSEAILAVESLLALNGIAITEVGTYFLKAVPSNVIAQQVPTLIEGTTQIYAPSLKIYSKFYELDYLQPAEAIALVQPYMTQGAPLPLEKDGSLFVTDALLNLQRIETVLDRIDTPKRPDTEILFIRLQHTQATDIVRRLESLRQSALGRYLENNTSFDADERSNQIIALTHPSNAETIREIISQLDIDVAPLTRTEVYHIRHADATELATLLQEVITGQQQVREDAEGRGGRARGDQGGAQGNQGDGGAAPAPAQQAQAGGDTGQRATQFSDFLTLTADERSNAIVISGTDSDHEFLQQLIGEIDVLLAQVKIEVVIVQVALDEATSRGIDAFTGGTGDGITLERDPATGSFGYLGNIGAGFPQLPDSETRPFAYNVNFGDGGILTMDFVLGRARNNSNVEIIQAPEITTTHNQEATISVGQSVPVITSTTSNDLDPGNEAFTRSSIQFRDVNLELTVTPLIGDNGIIQLEIQQRVESQVGTVDVATNQQPQPIFGTREATSFVGVADGQMIVLGGLQETNRTENEGKMFLLGDIPFLGRVFRSKTVDESRTELLIFIRPTVIRDTEIANSIARESIDSSHSAPKINQYLETGTFTSDEEEDDEKNGENNEGGQTSSSARGGPRR